jgi:hypothetical protein
MSEFSESFHFPNSDLNTLFDKLQAGRMRGRLYGPSMNRWASFVPLEGVCQGHKFLAGPPGKFGALLGQVTGRPVLEYIYAEDQMWFAGVWERGEVAGHYSCDWVDGSPKVESRNVGRLMQLPMEDRAAVAEALKPQVNADDLDPGNPLAYRFADGLGLPVYQWCSAHYLAMALQSGSGPDDGGLEV